MWIQKEIQLKPKKRGFHIISSEIIGLIPEIKTIKVGLANFFIQHTSASLTINENVSADVRYDMETHFTKTIPEDTTYYQHTMEGADDMPAHIKSSIIGASLNIPITSGELNLGTWQGIYLGEHRDFGGARRIIITITGD